MDKVVNIKVNEELWKQVKIAAVKQGIHTWEWVRQALEAQLKNEARQ